MSNSSNTTEQVIVPSGAPVAVLLVLGVFGNILALVLLICSVKTHKWRPFYRLVCGLAVTDGLCTLTTTTMSLTRYAELSVVTRNFPKHLCNFMAWNMMFSIIASGLIVCAMSWDRFTAIVFPVYYKHSAKKRRTIIILISIWIISAFLSSLSEIASTPNYNFYPGTWCFFNFIKMGTVDRALAVFYFIFGTLMVLITVLINVIVLIFVCRTQIEKRKLGDKRNIYIIVFLFTVVMVFSTCVSPLLISIFGHIIGKYQDDYTFELTAIRMAITNCLVDPWLYILFRRETVNILQKLLIKFKLKKETGNSIQLRRDLENPNYRNSESRTSV